jgi:hypothetical protein
MNWQNLKQPFSNNMNGLTRQEKDYRGRDPLLQVLFFNPGRGAITPVLFFAGADLVRDCN